MKGILWKTQILKQSSIKKNGPLQRETKAKSNGYKLLRSTEGKTRGIEI
jgi:hypothetical protein